MSGVPEADLKWGGHGLSEVSWAPKGPRIGGGGGELKIKTKMLISGHFSGFLNYTVHALSSPRTRELTAMYTYSTVYMIALYLVTSDPDIQARRYVHCMLLCLHCHTRSHTHSLVQ